MESYWDIILIDVSMNNINRLIRTVIYTLGHVIIAVVCNRIITGAEVHLALTDAIVEPIINGIWFYILDWSWSKYHNKNE